MEDKKFRLMVNKYIFEKLKEMSTKSASIFASYNKHRGRTMQSEEWLKLMEEAGLYLSTLI